MGILRLYRASGGYRQTVRFVLTLIAWLTLASTAHAQAVLDTASDALALNPLVISRAQSAKLVEALL